MHNLRILIGHPRPPNPPQMPRRLQRQILDQNPRQNNQFRLHRPQNTMIAQIEAIRQFLGEVGKIPVCGEDVFRVSLVRGIDHVEPVLGAEHVSWAGLPVFAVRGVTLGIAFKWGV